LEREAQVIAVAVDELDLRSRLQDRERARHERVRRAEDRLAAELEELERGESRAGPARRRDARQAVPARPGILELLHERPVRPDLVVEDRVRERVRALPVTVVEADGEGVEVHVAGSPGYRGRAPQSCARHGPRPPWGVERLGNLS